MCKKILIYKQHWRLQRQLSKEKKKQIFKTKIKSTSKIVEQENKKFDKSKDEQCVGQIEQTSTWAAKEGKHTF